MVTLTMRHHRGQRLADLFDALSDAWSAAAGGHRSARRALDGAGVQHWVRRVEATVGENGWHLHVHALLFLGADATPDTASEAGEAMFGAWATRLTRSGLEAPLRDSGGLDARLLDLEHARAEVAGYVAKGTYESAALDVAQELASNSKRAGHGNRTPMQLLRDCITYGLADDIALWWEWEQGTYRRRAMTWKNGSRLALLGDDEERTDEEIAADTDGLGEPIAQLTPDAWSKIRRRPGGPAQVLNIAEVYDDHEDAFDLLTRWLTKRGLDPPLRPPPRVG